MGGIPKSYLTEDFVGSVWSDAFIVVRSIIISRGASVEWGTSDVLRDGCFLKTYQINDYIFKKV